MNYDLKNATTVIPIIPAKSQVNNTGSSVVDLQSYDFAGKLVINIDIGTKTVGDNDGVISFRVATSATNNVSNAVNYGTSVVNTTNNTTANGDIAVDPRDANRYLFVIPTLTGTNSPAYPVCVTGRGVKKVQ